MTFCIPLHREGLEFWAARDYHRVSIELRGVCCSRFALRSAFDFKSALPFFVETFGTKQSACAPSISKSDGWIMFTKHQIFTFIGYFAEYKDILDLAFGFSSQNFITSALYNRPQR